MKLFCISDAHLGAGDPEQERLKSDLLISWLRFVEDQEAELIICGDLFDFWFEYRYAVPRLHFTILAELSRISTAGRPVHYLTGNHDFWMGSFIANEVGLQLHDDELILERGPLKIYLCHGDGLRRSDRFYRVLKKILRHPLSVNLYRLLHPDLGVPLALFFSRLSRGATGSNESGTDRDYREFAFRKIEQGFQLVVLGHTHCPALLKHGEGWYLNPGNWIDAFTYAVVDDGRPQLYRWTGREGVPVPAPLPPPSVRSAGKGG